MTAGELGFLVFAIPAILGVIGFPVWLVLRWHREDQTPPTDQD